MFTITKATNNTIMTPGGDAAVAWVKFKIQMLQLWLQRYSGKSQEVEISTVEQVQGIVNLNWGYLTH